MVTDKRAQTRNRASAKRAGARFEIQQAEYLAKELENPYTSRQGKNGAKDLGDLAFVGYKDSGIHGTPLVVECKNTAKVNLASAWREAEVEAGNYTDKNGAPGAIPILMHKRHGASDPGRQWVTMDVDTFCRLLIAAGES